MPELPEVETVRRGLAGVFEGRRLTAVKALRRDLRFPLPTGFSAWLEGRTVATLGRRGKFLLFGLEDGATLIAHLGMSGRFRIFDSPPPPLERSAARGWVGSGGIVANQPTGGAAPRGSGCDQPSTPQELNWCMYICNVVHVMHVMYVMYESSVT